MIEYDLEIDIARSRTDVFDYVTDAQSIPEWAPGITRVEEATPGQVGVGAEITEYPSAPVGNAKVHWKIVEFEDGRLCRYVGRSFMADIEVAFRVEDHHGGTLLSVHALADLRFPFRLFESALEQRAIRIRMADMKGIKQRLETEGPVPGLDESRS